jgi:BlaI family transcriptional regulator, penicillinase repressor
MFAKTKQETMDKELTRAEEQVMHILWRLQSAFIKDIMEQFDPPRPAYTTVSTIVRILEKKGFVGHRAYGKSHEYFPRVAKKVYSHMLVNRLLRNYFNDSFRQMVSFFNQEKGLSVSELEALKSFLEEEISQKA